MYKYYGLAAIVIAIDQLTKWIIVQSMEVGDRISIIDPYFEILSHRNRGAAWGMLQGRMGFFAIVTIAVVIGIIYYFHTEAKGKPLFQASLMVLLGGALGNFIDRLFRGEVVDFIHVIIPVINYDFPIFNIADAALTIGVVMLIIFMILEERAEKRKVNV